MYLAIVIKISSIHIYLNSIIYGQSKEDTLLIKAAKLGQDDIIEMLLLAGADIENRNKVKEYLIQIVHMYLPITLIRVVICIGWLHCSL